MEKKLLCFGNENPEKNEKPILDKKICNIKFRLKKKIQKTYFGKIFKDSFIFSAGIGCSNMMEEAIAIIILHNLFS